ncbi:hypothetical protein FRC17_008482, partial [Serendipita sp. 399]
MSAVSSGFASPDPTLEELVVQYERARSTQVLLGESLRRALDKEEAIYRQSIEKLQRGIKRIERIKREMLGETSSVNIPDVPLTPNQRPIAADFREKAAIDQSTWNWFHNTVDNGSDSMESSTRRGNQSLGIVSQVRLRSSRLQTCDSSPLMGPSSPDSINSGLVDSIFMAGEVMSTREGAAGNSSSLNQSLKLALSGIRTPEEPQDI